MDSLLVLLALGDVLADAAVASEGAGRVEYRLAADADPDLLAGLVEPAQFHVAERLVRLEQRDMLGPCVGGHVDVVLLPTLLADRREGLHVDPLRSGAAHRSEAELLVLLPVHVGGEHGQTAETLFAFAHHAFGLLALHELPDLAADHAQRLQQALFRLAHFMAVESEHSDRLPFGDHRKKDSAMQADFANKGCLRSARIFPDIGQPQWLTRLPHPARQTGTRRVVHAT